MHQQNKDQNQHQQPQNQQQQGTPQPPQNTHHEEDDRALNEQHRADLQNQNIHGNHRE